MERALMVGEEEHLFQCMALLHFTDHGAVPLEEADYLEDWGFIKSEDIILAPMAHKFKIYELTQSGQKSAASLRKVWELMYVPLLERETTQIEDKYLSSNAHESRWSLSRERLDQERKSGRLSKVIERCALVA